MVEEGGNHWSLVVYDRSTGKFNYYDSSRDYNYQAAIKTVAKIAHFIDPKYPYNQPRSIELEKKTVPQQQNGYDCGVYVLAFSDAIAEADGGDSNLNKITPNSIKDLRKNILDMIGKNIGA
jgi:sentrin-specific protease 8